MAASPTLVAAGTSALRRVTDDPRFQPRARAFDRAMRVLALVLIALRLAAASVDLDATANARAIVVHDPAIDNHWHRLFQLAPGHAARDVSLIAVGARGQALTLLATRLLYDGPPWRRRPTEEDVVDERAWAARNREVQDAILRELRFHDDAALGDVYRRYLARVVDDELAISALIDAAAVDPPFARLAARALAVPTQAGPPGAAVPALRSRCLAWLIEVAGIAADDAREALAWALVSGTPAERIAALRLVPQGAAPDLVERAAASLIDEYRRGRMDAEGQAALVQATERLHGVRDRALTEALAQLVVDGERPLAAAAATALSYEVARDAVLPIDAWVERALRSDDPAMRHVLDGLILRHQPRAVRAATERDSPWQRLAEHRARLAAWDWQGVVQ